MDENHLHHPLLPLSTTAGDVASPATDVSDKIISSNFAIALRFLLIVSIGVISMWANHEASKGFVITVINDMKNTPVGEKFSLFYVSNDEITRLVEDASDFAAKILYPNAVGGMPEMVINEVDVHLTNRNFTHGRVVVTEHHGHRNKYVLSISPSIMEYDDFKYRIRKEIQRCMAEILLFNGGNSAPKALRDGMVEYITNLAGFGGRKPVVKSRDLSGKCWEDEDPKSVAQFLGYCESKNEGFVGRLNQLGILRDGWDKEGMAGRVNHLCESFRYSMTKNDGLIAMETISSYR